MDKSEISVRNLNHEIAEEVKRETREDYERKFTRHMGETQASGRQWVDIGLVNEKQQMEIKPHFNKTMKHTQGWRLGWPRGRNRIKIIPEHVKILLFIL